jgi:DNA-binding NtrC family response regulator
VGQDPVESAQRAIGLAREAGDEELVREAHLLLAAVARVQGRVEHARAQLGAAERLRDQVAGSLPEPLRASFLARPDLGALQVESAALRAAEQVAAPPAPEERLARSERPAAAPAIGFVGRHPSVLRLLASVRKVAACNSPVLILGESGTGKELLADAIHAHSERRAGPLVKVNCAALVETLLLSELFGHERGAFTGATGRRRGRFELADGGTLFLDEIGDISARTQVALLRVLQDHTFERVGGGVPIRTDVRIVCATHRDLRGMVERGAFREDLYYRLCGVTIEVPPLRRRLDDIPLLSAHLLGLVAAERGGPPRRLSAEALGVLERHGWPGNVRELQNLLRAAALFCEDEELSAADVREHLRPVGSDSPPQEHGPASARAPGSEPSAREAQPGDRADAGDVDTVRAAYDEIRTKGTSLGDLKRRIERDCIERALGETGGNITRAAALLGMKRPRLSQLVKQHGLLGNISEES